MADIISVDMLWRIEGVLYLCLVIFGIGMNVYLHKKTKIKNKKIIKAYEIYYKSDMSIKQIKIRRDAVIAALT